MVDAVDYHTAGEPFRIVSGGAPPLKGRTILDKRNYALEHVDHLRALLINEPRGHADMYGGFVTEPDDEDADLGVVFFHNEGYSTACGHGTIALVTWAVEAGVVPATEPSTQVVVDVPSGRLVTTARISEGKATSVRFRNVPSFVYAEGVEVPTSRGDVRCDIAFGGAFYASLEASRVGLSVTPEHLGDLIGLGREIKRGIEAEYDVHHPVEPRLGDVYGVIFHDDLGRDPFRQRNVTIFADGEVDRSPCGSGTSARLALLDRSGDLRRGEKLIHEGIVGTVFEGAVVDDADVAGTAAVVTEVEGSAFLTGHHSFVLDPEDPVGLGFILR